MVKQNRSSPAKITQDRYPLIQKKSLAESKLENLLDKTLRDDTAPANDKGKVGERISKIRKEFSEFKEMFDLGSEVTESPTDKVDDYRDQPEDLSLMRLSKSEGISAKRRSRAERSQSRRSDE